MADGFKRYSEKDGLDSSHEAGYDAYMTGIIYLGFTHFIKEKEGKEMSQRLLLTHSHVICIEDTTKTTGIATAQEDTSPVKESLFMDPSITPFYNKIFLMRCDIPYIDLQGEETARKKTPLHQTPPFVLTSPFAIILHRWQYPTKPLLLEQDSPRIEIHCP